MKRKIIIDTDPGVDDAIALMYASKCEQIEVTLLSTAGGNNDIQTITQNALKLCEILDLDVPVVQGSTTPLLRQHGYALNAQGKSGLGKYDFNRKKLKRSVLKGEAHEVMYEKLLESDEKTTIVAIGPMTNLAKLIQEHPDCKEHIQQIVFESGTKEKIFGVPYKSFNVGYDPEAAEVVFGSGIPLVMIPMELGHFAYLNKDDIKLFKRANKVGRIFGKMFDGYRDFHVGDLGAATHDACAIHFLQHPEQFKTEAANISVRYYVEKSHNKQDPDLNFGYVDIDFEGKPNGIVCTDMDIEKFKKHLFDALGKFTEIKQQKSID